MFFHILNSKNSMYNRCVISLVFSRVSKYNNVLWMVICDHEDIGVLQAFHYEENIVIIYKMRRVQIWKIF